MKNDRQPATPEELKEILDAIEGEGPKDILEKHKEKPVAFVYFITDGEYVKIGVATNVEKRLKGLQTANARKLSVLYSYPSAWPYVEESKWHEQYKDRHVRNEWFDILDEFTIQDDYKMKEGYYLTPSDMEKILNISHTGVFKILKDPDLSVFRFGRCVRIETSALEDYLRQKVVFYNGKRLAIEYIPSEFVKS